MKKYTFNLLVIALLFLGANSVLAQQIETKRPPKVSRFVTVGFRPVEFLNDKLNLNEFELGYEQFITRNTSVIGGVTFGIGKQFIKNVQGEVLREYDHNRYSVYAGLRSRLLNSGKFSLFGELQAGIRREKNESSRLSTNTLGFIGAGIGAEYRFSERMKGTFGIISQHSSSNGFQSSFNIGLQFGLGKKE